MNGDLQSSHEHERADAQTRGAVADFTRRPRAGLVVVTAFALFAVSLVLACTRSEDEMESAQRSRAAPKTDFSWAEHSPLHATMHAMWVDCASIMGAAQDAERPAFDEIETGAGDISRKAGDLARLWRATLEVAQRIAVAASREDWQGVSEQHERLWTACCDCHVQTWSFERRSITAKTLRNWSAGRLDDIDEGAARAWADRLSAPATRPMQTMMRELNTAADGVMSANDQEKVIAHARTIVAAARGQLAMLDDLTRNADTIRALAARGDTTGMKEAYAAMAGTCAGCHAQYVNDTRPILNPPPWK